MPIQTNMLLPYIITVYARAAEGEGIPAIVVTGRVDARRIESEVVCITRIRRIGPGRPSVTVDARAPQTTVIDIGVPAANVSEYVLLCYAKYL